MSTTAPTRGAFWTRIGLAALGGLIAATAFPSLDLGITVFVGVILLLWLWRDASPLQAAAYGFAWGFAFFAVVLYWIYYFGAIAFIPLVSALAAFTALAGWVVALLDRSGVRSVWITAAVWTLAEALRGHFPLFGGFPWAEIGVALHDFPPARALARWGGVPLVTFAVVSASGLVLHGALALRAGALRRAAWCAGGLALVGVATAGAAVAMTAGPEAGELRFALLQGNDLNRELTRDELDQQLLAANHFALADTLDGDYDLIVFPESAMDEDPEEDPYLAAEIARVAAEHDAFVLVNAPTPASDGRDFNENLLYAPDGRIVGRYAKQHLVPFGEYVPYRSLFGWIPALDQIPRDYEAGDEQTIFDVDDVPIASVICFENAFAPLVRGAVRDGAEVLVVTTNNRSYRRSSNAAQHVALSQMRAAETGRPILHASISGITAVVEEDGTVRTDSRLFVNGVTEGTITARSGSTPFVRYGDWALVACGLLLLGAVVMVFKRRTEVRAEGP